MGGDSKFQESWVAKGARPWLKCVKNNPHQAHCTICDTEFSIKSGGISSVEAHEGRKKHELKAKELSNNRNLTKTKSNEITVTDKPSSSSCRDFDDQVLTAELLQALKTVDCNQSFQSADGDNERFSRMFPDSEIAKSYKQAQTKLKYMVQYGIAPHAKQLILEDMKNEQFCFHFDETTTTQVKKQYDGYLTYFSKQHAQITCSYVGSLFVGRCPASALLDHFYHFIEDLNLDVDHLLNLGMDGPNVNKKFADDLMEELKSDHKTSYIDIGGCTLHTVHNGFGKGMEYFKVEAINLDQFVIDLHFFFERSSARREDLNKMKSITNLTVHYLLKHCESRWLSIEKVLVRVIEQLRNVKTYFLEELPKKKEFKGKNGVGNTKRYQRIAEVLKNPSLELLMAFVVYVAQDFKKYLVPLQTTAPMIHNLHSMMVKLVYSLMSKFIQSSFIQEETTNKTLPASKLQDVDVTDKRKHVAKVQVGAKATSLMKNLDPLVKKNTISTMVGFLEACTSYLLKNLPLDDKVLKSAKCLHPNNRMKSSSLQQISFLIQAVAKALGDKAMREAFNMKAEQSKYDLIDTIRSEFQDYQMETIPESMYQMKDEHKKESTPQKTSYWKEAYQIAGVLDFKADDTSSDGIRFKRIDDFWVAVSNIRDENGTKRYSNLWVLVKCIMVLSHGNADPERGFSINKHVLKIHGNSLKEDTIIAIRYVKDFIIKHEGLKHIVVTDDLLKSCDGACRKYKADQLEKQKLAEQERIAKEAAAEAAAAAEAEKATQKEKEKEVVKVKQEIKVIKAGLQVAEEATAEANEELRNVIANSSSLSKNKFVSKVTLAQTKIDMCGKRKLELSEKLEVILKKRRKIDG